MRFIAWLGTTILLVALVAAQTPAPAAKKTTAAKAAPTKTGAPVAAAKPAPRPAASAKPVAAAKAAPGGALMAKTDEEKTVYALGLAIARSIGSFELSPAEVELVKQGIGDGAKNTPAINIEEWGPKIDVLAQSRKGRTVEREKVASAAYITKTASEAGMEKTTTGLLYQALKPGTGANPQASDTVRVHYRGTLINGTEFDSSYKRNEPAEFPLSGVIPCWTEGVQKIKVGGKAKLVCPSDLAYGDQGRPTIPGGAALVFEVELLDIVKPAAPAAAPAAQ
jgi:FKBP-type peptidyl-prolyl cis-trans isomerase FkpA